MEDLPTKFDRGSATVPLLDGSNYPSWKKTMRILLVKVGVLPLVDEQRPANADA
ncbi:hypothetical protein L211DRAFT_840781 [Terfezia boudieri ATCC MYA-4762]|uniref:DUF4219 domain-containing protein n=1 Tax=Terfezia boudieri ATCC MYA-4762 TaxID=1051890 RepID=A0A3N4LIR5_9PEZI|nr:hypothetical protein L211DRAFT_840781 [Terfezia boudieri ATCC MYA-4762]